MAKKNNNEQIATQQVETKEEVVVAPKKEEKTSTKPNKKKDNAKKSKQPSKVGKRIKETASELKKVSWPSFGSVIKKTGVVLAVVLIFAVVLFGVDRLLAWLFDLLTNSMI